VDENRRFTYANGDTMESFNLEPLGSPVEGESGDLEDLADYNKLLSEYYSAYYEAYYQSYYR